MVRGLVWLYSGQGLVFLYFWRCGLVSCLLVRVWFGCFLVRVWFGCIWNIVCFGCILVKGLVWLYIFWSGFDCPGSGVLCQPSG